jgi:hypothetical protein
MLFRANKKWALAHSSLPSNHRCGHGILLRRNKIVCNCHHTSSFFGFQWAEKVLDSGSGFLLGVLAIPMVFTMVKRGEVVVDCVVNVVGGTSLLWSGKQDRFWRFIFLRAQVGFAN